MRGRGIEGLPKDNVSLLDNYSLVFFFINSYCVLRSFFLTILLSATMWYSRTHSLIVNDL